MKPVATTIIEDDHMPVGAEDEVAFSISPANTAWVMRSMADLYSNRELAVVREYSTNAWDSNKELALSNGAEIAPIHVTLPTIMNPYFVVQDYGVGMSERELKEVYTQFGESTKRDSDDFNGMLGFGSKSAIAYTNTFTVTSVKDGRKTVGVISRKEDAMGGYLVTMKIVLKVDTHEPSGVRIEIPVHNPTEFERKALDFYRFWQPGRVLVNGKPVNWAVGEKIDDNLYYYPNAGTSYVVMGNVPYRIANPDALFPRGMNKISFVAYVPMGAVEFTPSREDLKYSDHTKRNLHKIIEDFVSKSVATAKSEISTAANHADAYKAWTKWRNIIGQGQVDDLTYKGDKLVHEFALKGMRYDRHAYRYNTWSINSWSVSDSTRTFFVTDFDIELSAAHKKKINAWAAHMHPTMKYDYVVFTNDKITSPWVDKQRVVDWETVKKEAPKQARAARTANPAWGRKAGSFDLLTPNGKKTEQDVPKTKNLMYVMVQELKQSSQYTVQGLMKSFGIDEEVVIVPANRKDKFLRCYPEAKPLMTELESKVIFNGPSLLSKDAEDFLKLEGGEIRLLNQIDANRVLDPEVKRLVSLVKKGENVLTEDYAKHHSLAHSLGKGTKFVQHKYTNRWDRKAKPVTEAYPLFAMLSTYNIGKNTATEHLYFYMNESYKKRGK